MGLAEPIRAYTTRADVNIVVPIEDGPIFPEVEPAALVPPPTESIRYMLDCVGRRYPVDEYGSRIIEGSKRPPGISVEEWSRLPNSHSDEAPRDRETCKHNKTPPHPPT